LKQLDNFGFQSFQFPAGGISLTGPSIFTFTQNSSPAATKEGITEKIPIGFIPFPLLRNWLNDNTGQLREKTDEHRFFFFCSGTFF